MAFATEFDFFGTKSKKNIFFGFLQFLFEHDSAVGLVSSSRQKMSSLSFVIFFNG
jgi:hypothetical protein